MHQSSIKSNPFHARIVFTDGTVREHDYRVCTNSNERMVLKNAANEDLLIMLHAVQTVELTGIRASDDDA